MPISSRRLLLAALVGAALSASAPVARALAAPLVAAAGDIACAPGSLVDANNCQQVATGSLIQSRSPALVLALGDEQYDSATTSEFLGAFDQSWGAFKPLIAPAPGNHEYNTAGASGYFGYFGAAAGDPAKGYYSTDLGGWHIVSLNSNCQADGACPGGGYVGVSDAEVQWLHQDLAAHPGACTLAYWHHPLVGDGNGGNNAAVKPLWDELYAHGADLVLNGHDHAYERFGALDPNGNADPARGLTEIVVGTGGDDHYAVSNPSSDARLAKWQDTAFGAIFLSLEPDRVTWEYYRLNDATPFDAGTTMCHHPNAVADVKPATPGPGDAVGFDAARSTDPYGVPLTGFAWDFGDGAGANGPQATHVYGAAGVYTARLTVTNANGVPNVTARPITVTDPQARVPPAPPPTTPAVSPPAQPLRVLHVFALRHRFRPAVRGRRGARGTAFRIVLSRPGTALIEILRDTGRRARAVQRRVVQAADGTVTIRFSGVVHGRALPRGRYRVIVVARDASGHQSRAVVVALRVLAG